MKEEIRQELIDKGIRGVRSLVDFRREFLEPGDNEVEPAKFHYEWSKHLLFDTRSFAIEGFRESGKSTFIIDVYPKYCIFYPDVSRSYIVLIKNSATIAQDKLKELERAIEGNAWIRRKIIKVIESSGDAYEIIVRAADKSGLKMRLRIEAYGKGSAIRGLNWNGKRPSIVLADDLQDEEDAMSQAALKRDWVWFRSEVGFLGRNTRFFMIANNLGENCIIEQIASNPEVFGYVFYRIPIIENDKLAWPEMFSKEYIDDEKKKYQETGDIAVWMRNRMCVAVSPETQVFKRDDLRWYVEQERANIIARCNLFISCDFAGTVKETSDYTAYGLIGVDEEDYWYVLDIWYGRWDGPEQISKLIEMVRVYKPYRVGIECVGAHGGLMYSSIVKAMSDERCIFQLTKVIPSSKQSKEERIELALGQRVRIGKLLLPEKAGWLDEFLSELLMFTREGAKSKHDDLIDSVSMASQFAKAPVGKDTHVMNVKSLPRSSIGNVVIR